MLQNTLPLVHILFICTWFIVLGELKSEDKLSEAVITMKLGEAFIDLAQDELCQKNVTHFWYFKTTTKMLQVDYKSEDIYVLAGDKSGAKQLCHMTFYISILLSYYDFIT